jgi:hypothetical protein
LPSRGWQLFWQLASFSSRLGRRSPDRTMMRTGTAKAPATSHGTGTRASILRTPVTCLGLDEGIGADSEA